MDIELRPCPFCGVVPRLLATGLVRCERGSRPSDEGPLIQACPVMLTDPNTWNDRPASAVPEVSESMIEAAIQELDFTAPESRDRMRAALVAALGKVKPEASEWRNDPAAATLTDLTIAISHEHSGDFPEAQRIARSVIASVGRGQVYGMKVLP